MKSTIAWIATIFVMASGAAPVMAADWGGVKDMGGGVPIPVPAPAPVPTYDADSDWYIGLSLGGNLLTDATIRDSDPNMPVKDGNDIAASPTFGLTFGRYITPSLRWEIAVDYTPNTNLIDGQIKYRTYGEPGTAIETQQYGVFRNDTVKLSRTTALFNLLYDIPTGTRFTPYLGGGFGLTWRRLERSYTENASCDDTFDFPGISCNGAGSSNSSTSGSSSKNQINFAAAVQAGVSTDLTDSIVWDNGWQMLWESGGISIDGNSISGNNRLTFKDSILQQFRSGIRIKFD
ncbi:outer membrane beta-barrel protein [Hyphomicrobium sp. 802]|uniref:outer membrane beta-barrel protein n=1 Tax=Hyphomicrobium sp. 802 TaxID=1112272 RepID=UPI00045E5A6E|nr:outer membrane beta-barrel protein [Hyphomicrobium sp. 802]